jgi:hypothetical protein
VIVGGSILKHAWWNSSNSPVALLSDAAKLFTAISTILVLLLLLLLLPLLHAASPIAAASAAVRLSVASVNIAAMCCSSPDRCSCCRTLAARGDVGEVRIRISIRSSHAVRTATVTTWMLLPAFCWWV